MRTVFTSAVDFFQCLNLVEFVVAIGVYHPVKPTTVPGNAAAIDHDVQAVKCPEQSLRMPKRDVNFFDVNPGGVFTNFWRSDSVKMPVLVGGDEAAFVVLRHCHPGALFAFWNNVQQFSLEPFGYLQLPWVQNAGGRCTALARFGKNITPRPDTQYAGLFGRLPVFSVETQRFPTI